MGIWFQVSMSNEDFYKDHLALADVYRKDIGSARELMEWLFVLSEMRTEWVEILGVYAKLPNRSSSDFYPIAAPFEASWAVFIDTKRMDDNDYVDELAGLLWETARQKEKVPIKSVGNLSVLDQEGKEQPMPKGML